MKQGGFPQQFNQMPAFTQMAGGPQVLNMGLAPNMKGFPVQNGQQQVPKKDRAP
jgi:hypothetical protein